MNQYLFPWRLQGSGAKGLAKVLLVVRFKTGEIDPTYWLARKAGLTNATTDTKAVPLVLLLGESLRYTNLNGP